MQKLLFQVFKLRELLETMMNISANHPEWYLKEFQLIFEFNHLKTFFLFIYENVGSSIERCKKYLHLKKI